jgi:SAM-dependent methyltransferase
MIDDMGPVAEASTAAPWFSDEQLWIETFDAQFPPERFQRAYRETDEILALLAHQGGPVLDLGCGAGVYLAPLAERGIRATGIDLSADLLARARARVPSPLVELVHDDIRAFARPGAFELALSMYTSFGYSPSHDENMEVLRAAFAALRPGGRILIDMASAALFRRLQRTDFPVAGGLITRSMAVDDARKLVHVDYEVRHGEHSRHFPFSVPLFRSIDLETMLAAAGFERARSYSSLLGDPFDDERPTRLVVVAQKPC